MKKILKSVLMGLFVMVLVGTAFTAGETFDYKAGMFGNGAEFTTVGQTEPAPDTIVTENSFFNRQSAQEAVCLIAKSCITVDGKAYVSYEEFSELEARVEILENFINTDVVDAVNELYEQIEMLKNLED